MPCDTKEQSSVPDQRRVRDEDDQAELDFIIFDVVEGLGCTVHLHASAGSHHDSTEHGEGNY